MRALACCLVVVCAAAPARADEREEARREFALGQAADKQQNWQEAIEHYLRANDLVPHPFAIFNIANDYERLGKLREASRWYQRYLDAAPDSADRDKVARIMQDIAQRPAQITVTSTPAGGRVQIDGVPAGPTPYVGQVRGGFHRVAIDLDGERQQKDVTVEYAEPIDVAFQMRGARGMLAIHGEPEGAFVTVDNTPAGRMPVSVPVAPGSHQIRVAQPGYKTYDTTAVVAARGEADVPVTLQKGLDGTGGDGSRTIRAGYLFGAGGGADAKGGGALYSVELGITALSYDVSARVGKALDLTSVEILFRWGLTKGRISPTIALGYSYLIENDSTSDTAGTAGGFDALGGLRYVVSAGEHGALLLAAESGVRYHTGLAGGDSGVIVPIFASVQIVYR